MSERRFPWRALFFVSLAVNLLVLGAIGGALGAGARLQRQEPAEAVVMRLPGLRAFMAAVPPELRPQVREDLAERWRDTRHLRHAALDARREAFSAAAAEPYDAAVARAAFERMRAADQAVVGVFHENMAQALAQMTPQQRADVLESLSRAPAAAREGVAPIVDGAEAPVRERALTPEQRETLRERIRERREERRERSQ